MAPADRPADGERNAVVGLAGQYTLAARIILARLATLDWIHVADPDAGAADDFQFQAGNMRHAIQAKWSQYPTTFTWAGLIGGTQGESLLGSLAAAWLRIRRDYVGALTIHLRSNEAASGSPGPATSPLGRCTADGPHHLAAFIAQSFGPLQAMIRSGAAWSTVTNDRRYLAWEPAWVELQASSRLGDAEFVSFISEFELVLGPTIDEPLAIDHERSGEVAAVARELQAIVADPSRPGRLNRDDLLGRLGWADRMRYRNRHVFPVPVAYAANESARRALLASRSLHDGGYIALLGPAGSGKSTLLATMDWPETDQVCRYYSFVPDSPDPLSARGEATSFLHDLSLALDESGVHRTGYAIDLEAQRRVLFDQLDRAGQRFSKGGTTTVIVVDGLDHISREQRPVRSLLDELPPPEAIPAGVYVVLGSQSAEVLPLRIRESLRQAHRTIDLPPLSPALVEQLALASGPGTWLTPGQLSRLHTASEGHPLALTYILQDLSEIELVPEVDRHQEADRRIDEATRIGPSIEARYRGYLEAVRESSHTMALLSRLCRLRHPVNLSWVATWAEAESLAEFETHASTFFWRTGEEWRFIHNSFRLFLVESTARVAGRFSSDLDARLHAELADTCAASAAWFAYRDEELAHRFLADQHDLVLLTATDDYFRGRLADLRPPSVLADHLALAMRSAVAASDCESLVRLMLLQAELAQRDTVLSAEEIARAVLIVDPSAATEHAVVGGHVRIDASAAFEVAVGLARGGHSREAEAVVLGVGGLAGLCRSTSSSGGRDECDAAEDWAETRWTLSGWVAVWDEVNEVLPRPEGPPPGDPDGDIDGEGWRQIRKAQEHYERAIDWRRVVLNRCLDLAAAERSELVADVLTHIDNELDTGWRARARVVLALAALGDGDLMQVRALCGDVVDLGHAGFDEPDDDQLEGGSFSVPLGLRAQSALLLGASGLLDAQEIDALVPVGTKATWPEPYGSDGGFSAFAPWYFVRCLQLLRGEAVEPEDPTRSEQATVATRRFSRALEQLAGLEVRLAKHRCGITDRPSVGGATGQIVRLYEVPHSTTQEWSRWYVYRGAAEELFGRLIGLASKCGVDEVLVCFNHFVEAWNDRDRSSYWSAQLRLSVLETVAHTGGAAFLEPVIEELERVEQDLRAEAVDLQYRIETWLKVSRVWSDLGRPDRARAACESAVASAGNVVGVRDEDRQMSEWLDWIDYCIAEGGTSASPTEILIEYGQRLIGARNSEADVSDAAVKLVGLLWRSAPALATSVATGLRDHGVMNEVESIHSVLGAALADADVDLQGIARCAEELLAPIDQYRAHGLAEVLEQRASDSDLLDLANRYRDSVSMWGIGDGQNRGAGGTEQGVEQTVPPTPVISEGEILHHLLTAMTALEVSSNVDWSTATDCVRSHRHAPQLATRLIAEALRLRLTGRFAGEVAALAARSGFADAAAVFLEQSLERLPVQGWRRHWDGGSRLDLLRSALGDRDEALLAVARTDLVGYLTGRHVYGALSPSEILEAVKLVAGREVAASALPLALDHLDIVAPIWLVEFDQPETDVGRRPTESLVSWIASYLGHPIRTLDFGSRRSLGYWWKLQPSALEAALSKCIRAGGWTAEAALLVLAAYAEDLPPLPSSDLAKALRDATIADDLICAELARRIASAWGLEPLLRERQELPAMYRLDLPPVPERRVPELAASGVPFIDYSDPQQVVAPFDVPLKWVSDHADLDSDTVLYRASTLALASTDDWIAGGHHVQASRLKDRELLLTYRPWAYMAGRRALGAVLSELQAAGLLQDPWIAHQLGLIESILARIEVQPVDGSTPEPWRPDDIRSYDFSTWCDDASRASEHVAQSTAASPTYVLAERGEWRCKAEKSALERREVRTYHGRESQSGVLLPPRRAWASSLAGTGAYPAAHSEWGHEELVVHGQEVVADSRWLDWLAFHPAAAAQVGWRLSESNPFEWVGMDGAWRSRSVVRVRGQLGLHSRIDGAVGELWQVVLSDQGVEDVVRRFGPISRRVRVRRSLRARETDDHDEQTGTSSADIDAQGVPNSTS